MNQSKKRYPNKVNVWLSHYLNSENPNTFLRPAESARAAGYNCSSDSAYRAQGSRNVTKAAKEISKWLDEAGLSENYLKTKLLRLIEAKETKFFAHEGMVVDQKEVEALGIQIKALELAIKVKGLFSPEKIDITGLDGIADRIRAGRGK